MNRASRSSSGTSSSSSYVCLRLLWGYLCLLLVVSSFPRGSDTTANPSNLPPWVLHTTNLTDGTLRAEPNSKAMRHLFHLGVRGPGSDGENIDAILQFFWNQFDGVALELGAVDGTRNGYSETAMMEWLSWKRVLVEGNPKFRQALMQHNDSFVANVVICDVPRQVHYFVENKFEGGVVEFMDVDTLKTSLPWLYNAGTPPGDLSAVDWLGNENVAKNVVAVDCVPLKEVLRAAGLRHVNFFVLDVEGAELSVLRTIDWQTVTFDVVVIETEEQHRHKGFAREVATYMAMKGYKHVFPDTPGRNSWFQREGFTPSRHPALVPGCFKGAAKACKLRPSLRSAGGPGFDFAAYMSTHCPKM